jgi:glycosyltransferase 2 family protein
MTNPLLSSRLRKAAARTIPPIFYALLILFLVLYLRSVDFSKLAHLHVNWWYLLLASILALTARYLGTITWIVILRTLGATGLRPSRALFFVYAKSWMGRYIPGTAPWILGKIYFASQHGISKQKLAVGSLLEGGIEIVTLLVFSLALLLFDKRLDVLGSDFKVLMVAVAAAGVAVLIPRVFNWIFAMAYRITRRKPMEEGHLASARTIICGTLLYLLGAVINGLSLFFIAKGIDPILSYHNIIFATGAASLASAASMLAVFAPTGIGVREGIQLVLFALIMPKELAVAVTIATRLWSVGMDFVFFGLSAANAPRDTAKPTNANQ